MIRDFFIKKENLFIILIAIISIFFAVLGFLLLFLNGSSTQGPRTIPNMVSDIKWANFKSELLRQKIEYPEYMYIAEQQEQTSVGITIAEFQPRDFLTVFSNQEHVSIYPSGIDAPFFYGKTKESTFTGSSNQEYIRTEYLTQSDETWAVKLVPKNTPQSWTALGFVWIQTKIVNKTELCITENGALIDNLTCDPYMGQNIVYDGKISDRMIKVGYEVVNKNIFE